MTLDGEVAAVLCTTCARSHPPESACGPAAPPQPDSDWDVFVSHASADNDSYVAPLVAALEQAGVRCWYDALELLPGDHLHDKIGHGLRSSKVVLLCLSEGFVQSKWASRELIAAFELAEAGSGANRLLPLMLCEPSKALRAYPLVLPGRLYLRWESGIPHIVDDVRRVIASVDASGFEYWIQAARNALRNGDDTKALLCAIRAEREDSSAYATRVLRFAALLRLHKLDELRDVLATHDIEDWRRIDKAEDSRKPASAAHLDNDAPTLRWVLDELCGRLSGRERDGPAYTMSVFAFFTVGAPRTAGGWVFLRRLYEKPAFEYFHDDLIQLAIFIGGRDALSWVHDLCDSERRGKCRRAIASAMTKLCFKDPAQREPALEIARRFACDFFDDVRAEALICRYFHEKEGGARLAVDALNDRSDTVRRAAVDLLTGSTSVRVGEDWTFEEGPTRPADSALTDEIVVRLLRSNDEAVFDAITAAIEEGLVRPPPEIDMAAIEPPPSEIERSERIERLARHAKERSVPRLLDVARTDPSPTVRRTALGAIEDGEWAVPATQLRSLFVLETCDGPGEALEDLILASPDPKLDSASVEIARRTSSEHKLKQVLARSARARRPAHVRRVARICIRRGHAELVVQEAESMCALGLTAAVRAAVRRCLRERQFSVLAGALTSLCRWGLDAEAARVARACIAEDIEQDEVLLVAGAIPSVAKEVIEAAASGETPSTRRVRALRSLEYRSGDGRCLSQLLAIFRELRPAVSQGDAAAAYTALDAVDGALEFGSRAAAIEMLRDLFTLLAVDPGGSWQLRFTYDRLKALGEPVTFALYDDAGTQRPWGWPDDKGPFYATMSSWPCRHKGDPERTAP